jgi:Secretion system C-terminal sorting domain
MRNKNNTSLNYLFRSASAETEGEVISQSDVEQLLQSAKRSVPVTQSIGQKLFERLLSTPLKIGMTAMTTAACITLGLIAFWPTPQQTVNKAPILSHSTYGSQGTDGATQNISQPATNNTPFANYKSQPNEVTIIIPATPIATADSLQPIELTPEQLAQLGIVLEDNGDIDFYTKEADSSTVIHYGVPPSWGIRINLDEKLSERDIAGLHLLKSIPRIITNANGEKRFFSFESDTLYSQITNGTKDSTHISNRVSMTPGGPVTIDVDSERWVKVYNDSGSDAKYSNGQNVKFNIDTTLKSIGLDPRKFKGKVKVMIREDAFMKSDSMVRANDTSIQLNQTTTIKLNMIPANLDSELLQVRHINEEYLEKPIVMNGLIPIRIINTKNANHPNELIFWYEPSPELTSTLPAAVNPVPATQSKQLTISVYPNPTNGPATIHYSLTDAPRAYFSVRNLLGQEVLNGGMTSGTTGDANLDLSKLPAGVYLLITTTDNGERDVERVVVTK